MIFDDLCISLIRRAIVNYKLFLLGIAGLAIVAETTMASADACAFLRANDAPMYVKGQTSTREIKPFGKNCFYIKIEMDRESGFSGKKGNKIYYPIFGSQADAAATFKPESLNDQYEECNIIGIGFADMNKDGLEDIITVASCLPLGTKNRESFYANHIYFNHGNATATFQANLEMDLKASNYKSVNDIKKNLARK
jgi:hypothetical protein